MRLEGRVAIVTGGGRNLGKAFAQRYLEEGATVVIAEVDATAGAAAAEELRAVGEVTSVATDVTDRASTDALTAAVVNRYGRIDVLLNNAGIWGGAFQTPDEKIMAVNMHGVWTASAAVAKHMVQRRAGKIVNVASIGAYSYVRPGPAAPQADDSWELPKFGYTWSKWNVLGLTRFMAGALGPHGICVNCISPGVTMTESTTSQVPAEYLEHEISRTALKRACQPEDITGAAVFFASADSDLVTGQNLNVDAGMNMRGS